MSGLRRSQDLADLCARCVFDPPGGVAIHWLGDQQVGAYPASVGSLDGAESHVVDLKQLWSLPLVYQQRKAQLYLFDGYGLNVEVRRVGWYLGHVTNGMRVATTPGPSWHQYGVSGSAMLARCGSQARSAAQKLGELGEPGVQVVAEIQRIVRF
jgi:hypothetical protein